MKVEITKDLDLFYNDKIYNKGDIVEEVFEYSSESYCCYFDVDDVSIMDFIYKSHCKVID